MSTEPRDAEEQRESSANTLGALLYANEDRAPRPERAWVVLVQAIGAGDQLALHALYERAHRPVFTLAMRITNNRQTAEELTIDVFHDVWRNDREPSSAGS